MAPTAASTTIVAPQSLADAILSIVFKFDWVSFAELPRRLTEIGHDDTRGNATIELPGDIILWAGYSMVMVDAICQLLEERRLFAHPASPLTYLVDGGMVTLPIAKQPPVGGYRTPHWLPCCLRVVPIESRQQKRRLTA
jgi:hypothetical protein